MLEIFAPYKWEALFQRWPDLLTAFGVTVGISVLALVIALVLGILFGVLSVSRLSVLRGITRVYVEVVQNVPLLLQVFVLYAIFPLVGLTLAAFWIGVLAIGIYHGGYMSEVVRSGIGSIHRGQFEAAKSQGFRLLADHVPDHPAPGVPHHPAAFGRAGGEPGEEHERARAHRRRRAHVLLQLVRRRDQLLRAGLRGGGRAVLRHLLPAFAPGAVPGAQDAVAPAPFDGRRERRAGDRPDGSHARHARHHGPRCGRDAGGRRGHHVRDGGHRPGAAGPFAASPLACAGRSERRRRRRRSGRRRARPAEPALHRARGGGDRRRDRARDRPGDRRGMRGRRGVRAPHHAHEGGAPEGAPPPGTTRRGPPRRGRVGEGRGAAGHAGRRRRRPARRARARPFSRGRRRACLAGGDGDERPHHEGRPPQGRRRHAGARRCGGTEPARKDLPPDGEQARPAGGNSPDAAARSRAVREALLDEEAFLDNDYVPGELDAPAARESHVRAPHDEADYDAESEDDARRDDE